MTTKESVTDYTNVTKIDLQTLYITYYNEAWAKRQHNAVAIDVVSSKGTKTFVERDFYMCGFNYLHFRANTPANRKLRKLVPTRYDSYWGYIIDIDEIGRSGNGDHYIQAEAFSRLADYLTNLGFTVYHESRLD